MKEITDEQLDKIRTGISDPLVQSLVRRLDRVEGEKEESQRTISRLEENALYGQGYLETAYTDNTALRERVKRMEEALRCVTDCQGASCCDQEKTVYEIAQAALKEGE